MRDPLRYRVIDEPRPGPLQRIALPPLLVFMVAVFFQPWGLLLIALNALALNGPFKWREIGFTALAVGTYYAFVLVLGTAVNAGLIAFRSSLYIFVVGIGIGLVFASFAYVSQARTAALRQYLAQDR